MCKLSVSRLSAGKVPALSMRPVAVITPFYFCFIDPNGALAKGYISFPQKRLIWGWICGAQMDLFKA